MGVFDRLLGKDTTTSAIENTKTTRATAERIKNLLGIRQLESMPAQAARAFQLTSDPRAQLSDFVHVIEADEAISARIIRVANSVYFFRGTPANDIEKAVANIGLDELRCLISATMLRSLLQGKQNVREQIWANSVATGVFCRSLSAYTNISEGEAFLCGLLHDVGKLVMIRRDNAGFEKALQLIGKDEQDSVATEESIFQTNHTEVGKWVAETWNFPASAVLAISLHHSPWPESTAEHGKNTSPAMLVKVADTISHSLGIGHPAGRTAQKRMATAELPYAFRQLGLSTKDGETLIESFKRLFEEEYARYRLEDFQH